MVTFFDENQARILGLRPRGLKIVFFVLLSACVVAAMQTVGAFLVVAMVITPGATAHLLCNSFPRLIIVSVFIGTITCFFGTYISYFVDGATGGIIVLLQTLIFISVFMLVRKKRLTTTRYARALLVTKSNELKSNLEK